MDENMKKLVELPSIVCEKRQPLQALMTAQSRFGRAIPMAMRTSCPKTKSRTTASFIKRSYCTKEFTRKFDVDRVTQDNRRKQLGNVTSTNYEILLF